MLVASVTRYLCLLVIAIELSLDPSLLSGAVCVVLRITLHPALGNNFTIWADPINTLFATARAVIDHLQALVVVRLGKVCMTLVDTHLVDIAVGSHWYVVRNL